MIETSFYSKEIVPGHLDATAAGGPAFGATGKSALIDVVESEVDLYYRMAVEMYQAIARNNAAGKRTVFIVPVGPTFQYRRFVYLCREMPIDLSGLHLFFMDEYLAPGTAAATHGSGASPAPGPGPAGAPALIDLESPLSFRGFVQRELVEPLQALEAELAGGGASHAPATGAPGVSSGGPDASGAGPESGPGAPMSGSAGPGIAPTKLGFSVDQIYFPDPAEPEAYDQRLSDLGGADICFAGVGINGHLAFNEPPAAEDATFFNLGTRIVDLSRETITINSNTALGGAWEQIPTRAITVGMKQILASRSLRIFLNRPWQRAVVRKLLFGPVTSTFPASSAQEHADARVTMTVEVASPPQFALR